MKSGVWSPKLRSIADAEYPAVLMSRGVNCCGREVLDELGDENPETGPLEFSGEGEGLVRSFHVFDVAFERCLECSLGESVPELTVASRPERKQEYSFGPYLSSMKTSGALSKSTASLTRARISSRRSNVKYREYLGRRSLQTESVFVTQFTTGRLYSSLTRKAPANVTNTN